MVFRFRVCFYLSVLWRGWADILPYLAIMIMIIIIMMMIIIVICSVVAAAGFLSPYLNT